MNEIWLKEYFELYKKPLFDQTVFSQLLELKKYVETINNNGNK